MYKFTYHYPYHYVGKIYHLNYKLHLLNPHTRSLSLYINIYLSARPDAAVGNYTHSENWVNTDNYT